MVPAAAAPAPLFPAPKAAPIPGRLLMSCPTQLMGQSAADGATAAFVADAVSAHQPAAVDGAGRDDLDDLFEWAAAGGWDDLPDAVDSMFS